MRFGAWLACVRAYCTGRYASPSTLWKSNGLASDEHTLWTIHYRPWTLPRYPPILAHAATDAGNDIRLAHGDDSESCASGRADRRGAGQLSSAAIWTFQSQRNRARDNSGNMVHPGCN